MPRQIERDGAAQPLRRAGDENGLDPVCHGNFYNTV
jgi:hypothetical protein